MVRDRTTTSYGTFATLVAALLVAASPATLARADQVQIFPSDTIWTFDVSAKPVTGPAAAGDRLFIALQSGIQALRMADRSEIWTSKAVAVGPMAVASDRLIVPIEGAVQAFDAATGAVVWTVKLEGITAPLFASGDFVFVAAGEQVSLYRLADGTQAWTRSLGIVEQRPAVHRNWLYVPVADGRIVALDLESGVTVWETDAVGVKPAEPLIVGDRLFVGSEAKQFCSIKLVNAERDWCFTVGAGVVGAAVADKARVYFVALDNQMVALDRSGALKWRTDLHYRPSAGPTLFGETVAAPGKTKKLIAFGAATGKEGASLTLADELAVPPVFISATGGAPTRVAALFGGLNNQWKLTLAGPPPATLPSQPVVPLTTLPGQVVRRAGALVARE